MKESSAGKLLHTVNKFFSAGFIKSDEIKSVEQIDALYKVQVPLEYSKKAVAKDHADPIWKTFVPTSEELINKPFETDDPINDHQFSPVNGLVHRHADRVLLMPTSICAVYCRFCFRKDFVGKSDHILNPNELETALNYIKEHKEIWEVILTGGDPFILSNERLKEILVVLTAIEHVKVIRFHTRMPVVLPSRIDEDFIRILTTVVKSKKAVYIVVHVNNVQEIDDVTEKQCASLIDNGIVVLSQTVLLKGINDNAETLKTLMKKLVEMRIRPYYLHHTDMAKGTSHFRTTISEGQEIVKTLRKEISGICQPTYVLDVPGGHGKVPVIKSYIESSDNDSFVIEGLDGQRQIIQNNR